MRPVGHRNPRRDVRAVRRELLDQWHERQVEADGAVAGVVDDVDELIVKEARVDRMDDRTHAGHRIVELEMPEAVPGQRADTVAAADA
jgi:hypothetical protein